MAIELTIQISEHSARILRSWASVAHSLDALSTAAGNVASILPDCEGLGVLKDEVDNLEYLRPPLSELCTVVKQALIEIGVSPIWDPVNLNDERRI